MNLIDLIEYKKWLQLVSISAGGKNRLRVIICLAEEGGLLPRDIMGKHVSEIMKMPVERKKVPHYELLWSRHLMFSVRDEAAAGCEKTAQFEGHGIRRFKKSWLLDSFPQMIISPEILPASVIHWGIYCLDDVVDILAYEEPTVKNIGDA